MRRSNTESIRDLIQQAIKDNNLSDGLDEVRVKTIWKDLTGIHVTRATTEISVHTSKLFVRVNSSIIRSELMLIRSELVKRINKELGRNFISEIVIR
ncbi:MAG: DUF721 domain-containing protein [Bacteroidales bacterium]|jgi:hypothetical protein|nr:DUF721 domain-containing protein [Bacteroidales bacterium]